MKRFLKFVVTFVILIGVFNLLLLLSSLFSPSLIEENVKESSEILTKEGNVYTFFESYNVQNNNYTDSLIMNEAYSIDNARPFFSYMTARKNYKEGQTKVVLVDNLGESTSVHTTEKYDPVGELKEFINGNIDTSVNYARYWHGYLTVIRPLLILFNISQIRTIFLIVFILLFICLMLLLKQKLGIKVAIIYALALILEDYFFVSYSLESAPVFITMMLACIILLIRIDKIKDWYLFVFIVSCITNFVDYLTVPLITLAMPLYIYILYNQKNDDKFTWKYCFKLIVKSSIVWILGYGLTWLSKWVLYDLIYSEGLIVSAISQVLYRSEFPNWSDGPSIWEQLLIFLSDKLCIMLPFLLLLLCLCAIYYIYTRYIILSKTTLKLTFNKNNFKNMLSLVIISLMPFVWYIVLANHTLRHAFFVYRHLLIFFTGLFLCINNLFILRKEKRITINKKD